MAFPLKTRQPIITMHLALAARSSASGRPETPITTAASQNGGGCAYCCAKLFCPIHHLLWKLPLKRRPSGQMTNEQSNTAGRGVQASLMPVAFTSHGSPVVAIETGPYQEALARFGREHRPKAIVVISAHWDSGDGVRFTSTAKHQLMYDFGGFPGEVFLAQMIKVDQWPPASVNARSSVCNWEDDMQT